METLLFDSSSSTSDIVSVAGFVLSDSFLGGKLGDLFSIFFYFMIASIILYAVFSLIRPHRS